MQNAYYTTATVLPGNRIECSEAELREGEMVRVVVIPDLTRPGGESHSALDMIEAYDGPPVFGSVEAMDRHINEERDSWER
ncbi:MAG: hypothetical protein EXS09_12420 [Gemmataceae bacterium]|nr:hypothetical protein [Gemmataceae bacterium]